MRKEGRMDGQGGMTQLIQTIINRFSSYQKNKKKMIPVKDMQLLKTVEVELHSFITLAVYGING